MHRLSTVLKRVKILSAFTSFYVDLQQNMTVWGRNIKRIFQKPESKREKNIDKYILLLTNVFRVTFNKPRVAMLIS